MGGSSCGARPSRAKCLNLALAAALAAGAAGAAPAPPARPLCAASVSLEPERAYPGQQVLYRLRLLVRDDVADLSWEEAPSFPGLRSERLAARPMAAEVERGGVRYQTREDLRALFADSPGRVELPPARLLCRARPPAGEARADVPGARLEVLPLPEPGRPGSSALVGPLSLRRSVTPERVALGQSVRVAITLQGAGNLWDAPAPELAAEELGGAEVFRRPAELELDRGERLLVRRRFGFDLVPRQEGVLRIPAFAWVYFDLATGRFVEAVSEATEVAVGPPAPPPPSPEPAAKARSAPGAEAHGGTAPVGGGAWILGAMSIAAGLALWPAWRRRRARLAATLAALARADSARAGGDRDGELAALARALRAALAAQIGAAAGGPAEAILAGATSPRVRRAAELLAELERARFDPAAEPPARTSVVGALAGLGARRVASRQARGDSA